MSRLPCCVSTQLSHVAATADRRARGIRGAVNGVSYKAASTKRLNQVLKQPFIQQAAEAQCQPFGALTCGGAQDAADVAVSGRQLGKGIATQNCNAWQAARGMRTAEILELRSQCGMLHVHGCKQSATTNHCFFAAIAVIAA